MKALRDGRYATRWVHSDGHYALERTLRREGVSVSPVRIPAYPRPACPLAMILYANGALFVFGLAGYLAYLLR